MRETRTPPSPPQAQPNPNGFKRLFDVVGAVMMLLASSPIWLVVAIAIKLESRGPVFFRQKRVGRGGQMFRMMKFRKMPEDLPAQGPMLTRRCDPRLTRVGALLERTKLDELPQLINVLKGEMSLIGPRPEVEKFVDMNDARWQTILHARPGLFGISQIQGRNESSLYPEDCEDLEAFYRESILPEKLDRDASYVHEAGLLYDLRLLIQGILISVFGTVTGSSVHAHAPQLAMLGLDVLGAFAALWFSLFLNVGGHLLAAPGPRFWDHVSLVILARGMVFIGMGIYRRRPQTLTNYDTMRIIKSVLFGSTLFFALSWATGYPLESQVLMVEALTMAAFLIAKAYGVAQLLRSHQKHKGWWPTKLAAFLVASATLVGLGVFFLMLRITHPIHLAGSPELHLVWLGLVYMTIRGYGMYRYGLLQPSGGLSFLKDTPRILAGTAVGTLLIYLGDTVCESSLVTTPVLAVDVVVTLVAVTLVRSKLWESAKNEVKPSTNAAGSMRDARLLLVGAGPETEFYLSYLETVTGARPPVVGVLDTASDAPRAQTISGIRVLGGLAHLRAIVEAHKLDHVVYFAGSVNSDQEAEMKAICERNGAKMSAFPNLMLFSANGRTAISMKTRTGHTAGRELADA